MTSIHSNESINTLPKKSRVYPTDNLPCDVELVKVAMQLHKTPHSMCNQPQKKCRSNPSVVLIPATPMPKGAKVIDLSTFVKNQDNELAIVLRNDGGLVHEQLEAEDINPNVQAIEVEDIDPDV